MRTPSGQETLPPTHSHLYHSPTRPLHPSQFLRWCPVPCSPTAISAIRKPRATASSCVFVQHGRAKKRGVSIDFLGSRGQRGLYLSHPLQPSKTPSATIILLVAGLLCEVILSLVLSSFPKHRQVKALSSIATPLSNGQRHSPVHCCIHQSEVAIALSKPPLLDTFLSAFQILVTLDLTIGSYANASALQSGPSDSLWAVRCAPLPFRHHRWPLIRHNPGSPALGRCSRGRAPRRRLLGMERQRF